MTTLRYNKVIIATDADVDGMHIRLLLLTYFLQFFPDLIKKGHVYVLQTPLFRVRNGKTTRRIGKKGGKGATDETYYCYNDEERFARQSKSSGQMPKSPGSRDLAKYRLKNFASS